MPETSVALSSHSHLVGNWTLLRLSPLVRYWDIPEYLKNGPLFLPTNFTSQSLPGPPHCLHNLYPLRQSLNTDVFQNTHLT